MRIYGLKTNYQENPLGIELSGITFSWKVEEAEGKFQIWARLVIGRDREFGELVYDSGEAELNSCACTPQVVLEPATPYYWKVTVRDDAGGEAVSETAVFEGGHPRKEWDGSWIEAPFVKELHPVFQKTFFLEEKEYDSLITARLYLCGLGVYEVFLNGEKVGDEYLTPYFTDYRYWIQYQTYDVQPYLKPGNNQIDVYLGNGWYKGRFGYTNKGQLREYYGDRFKLLANLYVTGCDGGQTVIATDDSWLALKSPVASSGIYDGEVYDSRMESGLKTVIERQKLYAVLAKPPGGVLSPMTGVAVRKKEVLPVKEIITTSIGETVLDFGQEITGWVAFQAEGPEGRRITLQYGEVLQEGRFYRENLRTAQAEYTWIANGKKQFARPHFTFYGFRYVKITGMEVNQSNVKDFQAWALYSDIEETGFIETSNEKVNQLISNTKWSQKGNFLDIPTDCPQRDERLGWTGDAQIFSRAASYHMQTPSFFRKYMKDMGLEQREKGGAVPYVVPDILTLARQMNGEPEFDVTEDVWGEAGASVWGDAATIIPWNLYLHFGNIRWLLEQYDNMKQWTDFIIRMDEEFCGKTRLWTCGFHFGDWLSLDSEGDSREGGTDKYFVASAFYMHSAELTAKAAGVLGKSSEADYYQRIAGEVREAIRNRYMSEKGKLTIRTQTAYVIGIWFRIFHESEMEVSGEELCLLLRENKNHLSTGFVGTAYLCQALSETGHLNEAYDLLFHENYPGWLYEVNLGATTIWERWNSLLSDGTISSTGMNSLNHYAYGVIAEWIYCCVCGLQHVEEGAGGKRMRFAPRPDKRLSFVRAAYRSAAGDYDCGWEWKEGGILFFLTVPFDCCAEVDIPSELIRKKVQVNGILVESEELRKKWYAGKYEIVIE